MPEFRSDLLGLRTYGTLSSSPDFLSGLTILPISPYLLSPGRYPWLGTSLPYSATSVLLHLRVVLTNLVAFRSPGSIPGPTGTPIYKRRVVTAEPQFGYLVNPVLAYSS